jgi:hypothetical protein
MTAGLAVLAAPLAVSLLAAQVMTPPRRVTEAPERHGEGLVPRATASADAQSFARALAQAGHAAGFIMPIAERQGLVPPDSGEMLTLDEAVDLFIARGRYRASRQGGAVILRHVNTPDDVARALEAEYRMPALKQPFSAILFGTVLRSLARRPVGGTVGREPGAGPGCPVEETVAIPAARASLIDTLTSMVTRTKGIAWMVRFGPPGDNLRLQVGYVCGTGAWSALSVPGW